MTDPIRPPNSPILEVPSVETIESYIAWLEAETLKYRRLRRALLRFHEHGQDETEGDSEGETR